MNTNIVITLDMRRKKQDGTYPLILRLGHQRTTISIPLGVSIKEKDWDEKNKEVKKSYVGVETVTRLNNLIHKKRSEAMDIILKLHEAGQLNSLSVLELKDRIHQGASTQSFFHYTDQLVEDLKKANRFGTARSYKGVKDILKKFNDDKDLPFRSITYQFLTKFETAHRAKKKGANGLATYMRTIRSIFNQAIKTGLVDKELYPFTNYKIKTVPTEKRALDWELLKKIIELDLKPGEVLFNTRNYFVASYMMYGMNFSDMAYLKKEDIRDGRLTYRRQKTKKIYDIKVTANLNNILSHYMALNPNGEFIFPIIKREVPSLRDKDIQWARKRYNMRLKDLADKVGIESKLTSYVSRHSFATQAMLQEVPLNAISTMLGHSNLKTTEIYLKSLPTTILDDYNSKVMRS